MNSTSNTRPSRNVIVNMPYRSLRGRRRLGVVILLLVLGSGSGMAAAPEKKSVNKQLARGEAALWSGDLEKAQEYYQKALDETDGRSVDARLGLARAHLEGSEFVQARKQLSWLLEQMDEEDSRLATAYLLEGETLFRSYLASTGKQRSNRSEKKGAPRLRNAAAALSRALDLSEGELPTAWYWVIRVHCFAGRNEEAHVALNELTKRDPMALDDRFHAQVARGSCPAIYRVCAEGQRDRSTCAERPEALSKPFVQYTDAARRARINGVVVVEALIDDTGQVVSTRIVKGLPAGLGQAAAEAVKHWRFEPPVLDGAPIWVTYPLDVHFTLR